MAFYFEKERTASTPYILVDEEKNYMKLEGRSFNENVVEYFEEINDWLDNYLTSDFVSFTFDCELNYINSSTVKMLLNMIMKMDKYACMQHTNEKKNITVNWITTKSNEIIIECGEDIQDEINNITFNLMLK
jgi:hypothetical protein